jgi:hypothetical protein
MGFSMGQQQQRGGYNGSRGNGYPTAGAMGGDGVRPHNYRTKPCRYFQAGMCKNGDRCTFLHTMDAAGQPEGGYRAGGGGAFGNVGMRQQW